MPVLRDVAARDETLRREFTIEKPDNSKIKVNVLFYPNRVTLKGAKAVIAPADDDEGEDDGTEVGGIVSQAERTNRQAAVNFCEYVAEWDMEGPWEVDGERVAHEGEMIPITVPVIRTIAAWLTSQIINQIMEAVFPNLRQSRQSRRR